MYLLAYFRWNGVLVSLLEFYEPQRNPEDRHGRHK